MKIRQNIPALLTINSLNKADNAASKAIQRLSSGLKINSAKDDAAGLAIANKLDTQVKGLDQANRNVMDGISMIQTAEGALNEVSDMLVRLKELATQGTNGTYDVADKDNIQKEMDALIDEINSIKKQTNFNGQKLFDVNEDIMIQIGANKDQGLAIDGEGINLYQVTKYINGLKADDADVQDKVNEAIKANSSVRGKLGAYQNRLEHTANNLSVNEENTTAALSRIQDTDMAEEMTNFTSKNIITQAANAMLAQANQRPQQVLQLLNR